jgi:hypothetical protein
MVIQVGLRDSPAESRGAQHCPLRGLLTAAGNVRSDPASIPYPTTLPEQRGVDNMWCALYCLPCTQ